LNLFGKPSAEVVGGGEGEGELQECAGQLNGQCFSVYFFGDGCRRGGGSFVAAVAAAGTTDAGTHGVLEELVVNTQLEEQ